MSKKKATMTLKDFHGGSIPSDLPLPSAPGVIVRPVDRGGFERNTSWGNPMGRSDHRLRPASASASRNLDEKTPFLSQSLHIGRNFDEDERKPLDGASGPRRTVIDEIINAQPARPVDPRMDSFSDGRVRSQPTSFPVSQVSSGSVGSSYAGMLNEVHSAGLNNLHPSGNHGYGSNYPNTGGSSGQAVSGYYPNAWEMRKETVSMKESRSAAWSAPDAATKLVHASALEQVSSGRWNSKQSVPPLKDAEYLGHPGTEGELLNKAKNLYNKNNYDRLDVVADTDYRDVSLVMHAQRSLVVDDGIRRGGKEMPTSEHLNPPIHIESYERNPSVIVNGSLSPRPTGKSGGIEFPSALAQEPSGRPKLKLLPRSRPLGNLEAQGYQQSSEYLHVEVSHGLHEPANLAQFGVTAPLAGDQAVERPKLNLKPRVSSLEQLERNAEARRGTVFGGARPREQVLKERGIEDSSIGNHETQSPLRAKGEAPKLDTSTHVPPGRYSERSENIDQRTVKYSDRRDHDIEKMDPAQRKNRRNDIWRDNRDVEKHQQQQERPPSPDIWRKPIEQQPKPASPDGPQLRYGKAASAVELAQAFSKSMSGAERPPNRGQVPFSRLMGPSPRPQVNGYCTTIG